MKISELMKENPFVITEDYTLEEAAQKMDELETGVLPVVEGTKDNPGKEPIGMLTDRDLVIRCIAQGMNATYVQVGEVFTRNVICCEDSTTDKEAFQTMRKNKVGRLLVKDKNGKLCGIVSQADIIANAPESVWDMMPKNASNTNQRNSEKKAG